MKPTYFLKTGILILSLVFFVSCSTDDDTVDPGAETYQTQVYLTDAPVDNPNVAAVFVTVAEVKVNGKSIEGFNKTTINLSSLQNGRTELLGSLQLQSGPTSQIVLVLDNETDASGASPGNYVLTANGEKKALVSASEQISINDSAEILQSTSNEIILDFDLRKTVVSPASEEYEFASDTQLSNSIRAVNKANAGTISGKVTDFGNAKSKAMVAFAYEKGAYAASERNPNAEGVRFAKAVSSARVNQDTGEFELHFIKNGDYEMHFVSYSDDNADGRLELKGEVGATSATGINLSGFSLESGATVNLSVKFTGILNL